MITKPVKDDILTDEERIAQYEMEVRLAKIRVTKKLKPYIRKDSKIVYQCTAGYYKCHVPKALIRQDAKPPQVATNENDLWLRLHDYLFSNLTDVTINDMYDRWILQRQQDADVTSETVKRDQQRYDKHIRNRSFSQKRISEITPKDVKAFLKDVTSGRKITRRELGSVKSLLIGIFNTAIDSGVISINPVLQIKTQDLKCKSVHNGNQVYTDAERRKLLEYLATIPPTGYTLAIAFMFSSDMRIGEVKALHWSDIDANRKTVEIFKEAVLRKDQDGKTRLCEVAHTKTEEGSRTQPLSQSALQVLQKAEALNPNHKPSDLIFTNAAGKIMDTNKFNRVLKRSCEVAGIRYLSSHKMRFYAITAMSKAGFDLDAIMYNSGHKCKSTTLHYIRHAQTEIVNAEKWESVFG